MQALVTQGPPAPQAAAAAARKYATAAARRLRSQPASARSRRSPAETRHTRPHLHICLRASALFLALVATRLRVNLWWWRRGVLRPLRRVRRGARRSHRRDLLQRRLEPLKFVVVLLRDNSVGGISASRRLAGHLWSAACAPSEEVAEGRLGTGLPLVALAPATASSMKHLWQGTAWPLSGPPPRASGAVRARSA